MDEHKNAGKNHFMMFVKAAPYRVYKMVSMNMNVWAMLVIKSF